MEELELSDEGIFAQEWESELTLLLGDQICALRESKNYNLETLAALAGLSPSYISEVEKSKGCLPYLLCGKLPKYSVYRSASF